MAVDCENVDPFKLFNTIKSLRESQLKHLVKIILFDDIHTPPLWDVIGKELNIETEHQVVERIHSRKSLVDFAITSTIIKQYYENQIDACIIASSDSDFYGLISNLSQVNFLVMYEHQKSSTEVRNIMLSKNIQHICIDNFHSEETEHLKQKALLMELNTTMQDVVGQKVSDIVDEIYSHAFIEADDCEKHIFQKKYIESLKLSINKDGIFCIERTA